MCKRVWQMGVVDRGVIKFRIYNTQGHLCGWLTLSGLIRRDEFKTQEKLTNTGVAEVVSLKQKAFEK